MLGLRARPIFLCCGNGKKLAKVRRWFVYRRLIVLLQREGNASMLKTVTLVLYAVASRIVICSFSPLTANHRRAASPSLNV